MADELAALAELTTAMDRLDPDGRRRALAYLADRYSGDAPAFGFAAPAVIAERSDPIYGRHEVDLRDDRTPGGYRSRPARPGASPPKLPSGPAPGARRRETPPTDRSGT